MSIDCTDGERRLMLEPSHDWTPEQEFERRWAVALLEQVLNGLQRDYESKGKAHLFAALKPYLTVDDDPMSYAQIAADLAMTVGGESCHTPPAAAIPGFNPSRSCQHGRKRR